MNYQFPGVVPQVDLSQLHFEFLLRRLRGCDEGLPGFSEEKGI